MKAGSSRFGDALQGAIDRALQAETPDIPAEHKAELLREMQEFHRKHRATIDLAVDGAVALAGSPEGRSQVERLEGSLRRDIARVDGEPARALLRRAELQPVVGSAQAEGVVAVSVGVSLGLSIVLIGAAAGADALINVNDDHVYVRGFGVADVGLDLFAGIGLNIGIWQAMPAIDQKTYIGGLLIDVPLGPAVIRVMAVREGPGMWSSPSDFRLLGFTIAINYGVGAGVMVYRGPQYTLGIAPRRASLTVCNCTDGTDPCKPGTSSVAQNVSSKLLCTLENTSEKTITIAPGSTLTLTMPQFFTSSDVSAIQVTPPSNWTSQGWDNRSLTLAYSGSSSLDWTDALNITLANVKPSQADPLDGEVSVRIPDAEVQGATIDKPGVVAAANLTLVPAIKYATISWTATFPNFTLDAGQPSSGTNVTAVSQDSQNTVVMLTEVTDSNNKPWELGYQFYIDDTTQQPYFRACWYEQGTFVKYGTTLFAPNFMVLTSSNQASTAYYDNVQGNPNTMQITVKLNS
jgi:hypothetical protein